MGIDESASSADPYSRVEYRRLIAWEKRLQRERPLFEALLEEAPDRSVVDLGCGTGEHVAFFAELGARAVGLDRSESMLRAAADHERAGHGRFVAGDLRHAREALATEPEFGLALCLGNVLPHLQELEELQAFAQSAAALLAPGGFLVVQILNYRGILDRGDRVLPVNVREGEDGEEIVFLRLMSPGPDQKLSFFPTTLVLDEAAETPVSVRSSRRVELRPWTLDDLGPVLEGVGFEVEAYGGVDRSPFDVDATDLVVVARRRRNQEA